MRINFISAIKFQNPQNNSGKTNNYIDGSYYSTSFYIDTVNFKATVDMEALRENRLKKNQDNQTGLIDVPPDMLVPVGDGRLYDEKPASVSSSPLRAQIQPNDLSEEMKEDLVKRLDSSTGKLGFFWHMIQKGRNDKKALAVGVLMYFDIDKQVLKVNEAVHDKTNLIVDEITEKIKDATLDDVKNIAGQIKETVIDSSHDTGAEQIDSAGGHGLDDLTAEGLEHQDTVDHHAPDDGGDSDFDLQI